MTWEEDDGPSIRKWIWRLISHNFLLKLFSLASALMLFLIVRAEQVRDYTKVARVRIVTNESMMVVGSPEKAVYVTVRVPMSLFLKSPSDDELVGEVDVRDAGAGRVRLRLTQKENFPNLDERYQLIIHDPWIEVDIDKRLRKTLEVRVAIEGKPRDGFAVERTLVSPQRIEVVGARRELVELRELATSVIDINGIDRSFSTRARIIVNEDSSLQLSEKWVNVQVIVGRRKEMRTFAAVPVEVVGSRKLLVRPGEVTVELEGHKDTLDALQRRSIRAFVRASDLTGNAGELVIHVEVPSETNLIRVTPGVVDAGLK